MDLNDIHIRYDEASEKYVAEDTHHPDIKGSGESPEDALSAMCRNCPDKEDRESREPKVNLTLYVSQSVKQQYLNFKLENLPTYQRYYVDNTILNLGMQSFKQMHGTARSRRRLLRRLRNQ